jgi:peptidoglycan/LPS O-acetylase OafA/YrhL
VNTGAHPQREYQPALDGLRGVAVTLVLLFHGGFSWMTGGYVGVSVFFTLSGFLITGLLLAEHDVSGRLSLRSFYARRVRRLLPASLFCLAAVAVLAAMPAPLAQGAAAKAASRSCNAWSSGISVDTAWPGRTSRAGWASSATPPL